MEMRASSSRSRVGISGTTWPTSKKKKRLKRSTLHHKKLYNETKLKHIGVMIKVVLYTLSVAAFLVLSHQITALFTHLLLPIKKTIFDLVWSKLGFCIFMNDYQSAWLQFLHLYNATSFFGSTVGIFSALLYTQYFTIK